MRSVVLGWWCVSIKRAPDLELCSRFRGAWESRLGVLYPLYVAVVASEPTPVSTVVYLSSTAIMRTSSMSC
jgi:hypothetical protein